MQGIIGNYSWIKVKKYIEPLEPADLVNTKLQGEVDWKYAYQTLNNHHKEETEFLINKCRELAKIILDGEFKKE